MDRDDGQVVGQPSSSVFGHGRHQRFDHLLYVCPVLAESASPTASARRRGRFPRSRLDQAVGVENHRLAGQEIELGLPVVASHRPQWHPVGSLEEASVLATDDERWMARGRDDDLAARDIQYRQEHRDELPGATLSQAGARWPWSGSKTVRGRARPAP